MGVIASKDRTHTEGHLLLEITLVDRTLRLAKKYIDVDDDETYVFEPLVLSWSGVETSRNITDGLSAVGDARITIANDRLIFMSSSSEGTKFSDLFDDYDFQLRPARLLQYFEGDSYATISADPIFTGELIVDAYDVNKVELIIKHISIMETVIPLAKVNPTDDPRAPKANLGRPIPLSVGDFANAPIDTYYGPYAPMVLTDENTLRLDIARGYESDSLEPGFPVSFDVLRWVPELGIWMGIDATNVAIGTDDLYSYVELFDPVYGNIIILPKLAGTLNNVDNWYNAVREYDTSGDTASLDGDDATEDKLSIMCGSLPFLGKIQDWVSGAISLHVLVDTIGGGAGTAATIQYYNEGYDDGVGGYSTGVNITGTGTTTYSFEGQKEAHGVAGGQEDQLGAWTWDELGSYEFYIEAQAGFTLEIQRVVLQVTNFVIAAPWGVRGRRTPK